MSKVAKNVRGRIRLYDKISPKGLDLLGEYEVGRDEIKRPDAILLRSTRIDVGDYPGLWAIARAGAGVDNINVPRATQLGIPVFYTPGANALSVAEITIGMIIGCYRNVIKAATFVKSVEANDEAELQKILKKHKSDFAGSELAGKTLGVIGLGQIGVLVANIGIKLGMRVVGYDKDPSPQNMHQLDPAVTHLKHLEYVLGEADVLTIHVPLVERTRGLIGGEQIALMKPGSILVNYARGGIVDDDAVIEALNTDHLSAYITDFPTLALRAHEKVICMPHLGASTEEAEDTCAIRAAIQLINFLGRGTVVNSVNMPEIELRLHHATGTRLVVINRDMPNMIGQVTHILGEYGHNIQAMTNESNGVIGYNLIDFEENVPDTIVGQIQKLHGVIRVRAIRFPKAS